MKYKEHGWLICGDLKVLCMLLGQQPGYTKFPCFLCDWDGVARSQHWKQKQWPCRVSLTPGAKNIARESLVDPQKVLLPYLHIKLGLMKQFVKVLQRDGNCFKYLCSKFPGLSEVKLKDGIFVGSDIRKLISDEMFETTMWNVEREAWIVLKDVISIFFWKLQGPELQKHRKPHAGQIQRIRLQRQPESSFFGLSFGQLSRKSWSR
jgi:hypothetical protein